MISFVSALSPHFADGVVRLAAGAVAAAVWQGVLLAGAAALGLRLLPETPARVRFAIWFGVFLLVAGLPTIGIFLRSGAGSAAAAGHAWFTISDSWCLWIAVLWAVASLVRAVSLAVAAYRVRALWKRSRPIALPEPASVRGQRPLELCVSDEVDRPAVIGFFSPRIVLPEWLLAKLTPAELQQVVLHESGHLSRRDDWLNLAQKLALVLFPLNPALLWIERRLCLERELACDERVLRETGAPLAYAECLARIAEYRLERRGLVRGLALALGAIGRESELARRVRCLLSRRAVMPRGQVRLVFGSAMLMLVGATAALERSPQLVAFSDTSAPAAAQAHATAPATAGFGAVAVRAAAIPVQQWRTTGDAPPRLAPKAVRVKVHPRLPLAPAAADWRAQQVVDAPRDTTASPRMVQTVATQRQVTPEGEVIVTRWVTVSTSSSGDEDAGPAPAPQQVRAIAVPVSGGWLVFQL